MSWYAELNFETALSVACAAACALVLGACGGGDGTPTPGDASPDSRLVLDGAVDAPEDGGDPFGEVLSETPGGGFGCCNHEVGLALGADGEPRMIGRHADDRHLWFSSRDAGEWTEEDSGLVLNGERNAFALGSDDSPHVLYSGAGGSLFYARREAGVWVGERVGELEETPRTFPHYDIELDADGTPHIVLFESVTESLLYGAWNGTAFELSVLDAPAEMGERSGEFARLTIGSDGAVHVSYLAVTGDGGTLRYAVGPGSWTVTDIPGMAKGAHGTIVLDGSGEPNIFSADVRSSRARGVYWSRRQAGSWTETEIHADLSVVDMDAALDGSDRPHLFLSESTLGAFGHWIYYRSDGATFERLVKPRPEVPPGAFDPGPSPAPESVSIAVDGAGAPHFAVPRSYLHF